MARYAFLGTTSNAFGTSTNWGQIANTATIHASASTLVTTSGVFSATFTAPNTTNNCVGAMAYVSQVNTLGQTVTCTLQEFNGVSWVDKSSQAISTDNLNTAVVTIIPSGVLGGWAYFHFGTPYTFTTTTANYYRLKFTTSSNNSVSLRADSGASLISTHAVTDISGVPAQGTDDTYVLGKNITTAVQLDITGTTYGVGTGTGASLTPATVAPAMYIGNSATVTFDETASCTFKHRGPIIVGNGGYVKCGSSGSRLNSSYTLRIQQDQNGVNGTSYFFSCGTGRVDLYPTLNTNQRTTYVSGTGTAANPLTTADAISAEVGDPIVVGAGTDSATNYNEAELKYIRTKPSSTTFSLANTAGGAESALSFTKRAGTPIVLLKSNIILEGTNTTNYGGVVFSCNTADYINVPGVLFRNMGSLGGFGLTLGNATLGGCARANFDNVMIWDSLNGGIGITSNSLAQTASGFVTYATAAGASGALDPANSGNAFSNFTIIRSRRYTLNALGSANTFTNFYCNACNYAPFASAGGVTLNGGNGNIFTNGRIDASAFNGVAASGGAGNKFYNCIFGSLASNVIDIQPVSNTYNTVLFDSCTFSSPTVISNYLNATVGSEFAFHNYNNTADAHRWYTKYGYAVKSGDSTTAKVRIYPEDLTTGFTWEYLESVKVGNFMSTSGKVQKSSGMASKEVVVSMYLPGSQSVATSQTMPTDTSENAFGLAATYSGSYPLYGRVTVNAKSNTAGDYVEIYQIDGGTNDVTNLKVWHEGKPSTIMFPLLGDNAGVLNTLSSIYTTPGTIGKAILDSHTQVSSISTTVTTISTTLEDVLTLENFVGLK